MAVALQVEKFTFSVGFSQGSKLSSPFLSEFHSGFVMTVSHALFEPQLTSGMNSLRSVPQLLLTLDCWNTSEWVMCSCLHRWPMDL